jgi:heme-degrading monooxygenase HmoA
MPPLTKARFVATTRSRYRKNKTKGVSSMIYEMRIYRCLPGRLPALLKRFENTTLKLWEKHGIKQAGFFTTLVGESNQELTYLLAWESLADREKKWAAFQSDPEWIAARAKTEEDGQIVGNIVNQLLVPTAFSSVK